VKEYIIFPEPKALDPEHDFALLLEVHVDVTTTQSPSQLMSELVAMSMTTFFEPEEGVGTEVGAVAGAVVCGVVDPRILP
jgi:hypothetical protein